MRKKQLCILLAVVVSVCCLISLIATIAVAVAAKRSGGSFPMGMGLLSLLTLGCTGIIWKGVREL